MGAYYLLSAIIKVMKNVIEVRHLTKSYKSNKAVDDLSFDVKEGEILGLLGPNGSGKTTTMNCILSLLKFNMGEITIFGKEMSPNAYDIKAKIGVVFQDVAVFDELTVYGNIDYFCGLYVEDKETRKQYVEEAIKLVGLEDNKNQFPKQLSGGLLRRLNIACGIAHKPKLIFLDEPTVAVDPQSRNNILEGIKKLRDDGATIIYTTHYMEEVEILCDRVIILDHGKIIASGTNDELKALAKIEEKVTIEVPELSPNQLAGFDEIKNVSEVSYEDGILKIVYNRGRNNLADMVEYLKNHKIKYNKIFAERPTLNDVFLELTGKELRD
jgi:ABC-2 type transport system ATP-binding protein